MLHLSPRGRVGLMARRIIAVAGLVTYVLLNALMRLQGDSGRTSARRPVSHRATGQWSTGRPAMGKSLGLPVARRAFTPTAAAATRQSA